MLKNLITIGFFDRKTVLCLLPIPKKLEQIGEGISHWSLLIGGAALESLFRVEGCVATIQHRSLERKVPPEDGEALELRASFGDVGAAFGVVVAVEVVLEHFGQFFEVLHISLFIFPRIHGIEYFGIDAF